MATDTIDRNQDVTTETGNTEPAEKTFTQDDVNFIVTKRLAKYADYEALKEKAEKYDAQVEASKSDLQKATEKAQSLQAELDALKGAEEVRKTREEVASKRGIPVNLLTGSTAEECEAQADALLAWAKPNSYPKVPDGGEPAGGAKKATRDLFADWFNEQF